MQLRLPLFPSGTKMISDCLGVYEKDGIVQYIANGLPIYAHPKDDLNAFRYITSNCIEMKLCRKVDVRRCFHVSEDFVYRAHKKFVEQGEEGFFGKDKRHGYAHKIVGDRKERNREDASASMGMATTRYEDRMTAARGQSGQATIQFSSHQSVVGAGVLFLLPALLSQGLLKTKEVYKFPANHYYGLESVMLTLAFMALGRIKNPEQLKQCKLGEIGRIIGLDRTDEHHQDD